uniref:Fc receptor-like protein 5 n=1 Tax=Callithrix jacchus TaxID=9483 RepID=UPI0023DD5DD6|nr:Fc receptor-like protein 5 [Callithrix jacchus]
MLLWPLMLVLAPLSGQLGPGCAAGGPEAGPAGASTSDSFSLSSSARTHRSIISLQPPWTTVFQGDRVTLTCKEFHFYSPQKTKWFRLYFGKEIRRETPANTLEVRESGEYRCQARGSSLSSPVRLVFSPASLILQAPLSVFEGDSVVLRCRAKAEVTLSTIYKDGNALALLNKSSDFHIHHASLKDNGAYHCTAFNRSNFPVSSNIVKIQVQGKAFIIL